jgi:adhesin/invasin
VVLALVAGACSRDSATTGPSHANEADFAVRLLLLDGNAQSGTVASPLGIPLKVKVLDANGAAVKGAAVTFTVRTGGGTVATPTAQSDSLGAATTVWTLGATVGNNSVIAILNARNAVDTVVFTATAGSGAPAVVTLTGGGAQNGSAGTALGSAVAVKVTDARGNAVAGTTVNWTVAAGNGGGFASPASSVTDASGAASTSWTLGGNIGGQTLTVTVAGLAPLTVSATAAIPASAVVQIDNGNSQSALNSATLPAYLRIAVVDAKGAPISGARVTWAVATGGGSVSKLNGTTDAAGKDSVQWTLGALLGAQTITAAVTGLASVTFQATALLGTAASIQIVSGNGQVGRSASALASPLVVIVRDAGGNPLSGATVQWAQASTNSDGYVAPSPALTVASGQASVTWTLGGNTSATVLTNSVTASVTGYPAAGTAVFTATARPQPRIRFVSGTTAGASVLGCGGACPAGTQVDTTGATLADTLVAQVYDPSTNTGVQGVTVTWATQANDGVDGRSVNSVVTTDNLGKAKTVWVLRSNAGAAIPPSSIAKRMVATAAGIGDVEFRAVVFAGKATRLSLSTPAILKKDSTTSVTLTVTDVNGNVISGASVTWTFAGNVASLNPASTTTGSDGTSTVVVRWTNAQGSADVTATVTTSATGPYAVVGGGTVSRSYPITP